jgi:hypothetical protein
MVSMVMDGPDFILEEHNFGSTRPILVILKRSRVDPAMFF